MANLLTQLIHKLSDGTEQIIHPETEKVQIVDLTDATTTASGLLSIADKTKLDGIATGAEANIINVVEVNGTALTVTNKTVNVDISTKADKSDTYTKSEIDTKIAGAYVASGSCAFASLPALSATYLNHVYNVTDDFTTTASFLEGAGKKYSAGTDVGIVEVDGTYYYNVFSSFVDTSIYAPLASPALTGTPTAPTASTSTDTTQIATTAFVQAVKSLLQPTGHVQYQYILEDGYIKLDGSTVSRTTYANLWAWAVAQGLTSSTNTTDTTKHLFGTGDGSNTFVLPNFVNLSLQGGSTYSSIGAGLPDIEGKLHLRSTNYNVSNIITSSDGVFSDGGLYTGSDSDGVTQSNGKINVHTLKFKASSSNSIYGSSSTVQPPAVKLIPQIKY